MLRRRRGVTWKDAEAIPLLAAPGPASTHVAGVPGVNGSALRAAVCGAVTGSMQCIRAWNNGIGWCPRPAPDATW
jgi:hypothetical protein